MGKQEDRRSLPMKPKKSMRARGEELVNEARECLQDRDRLGEKESIHRLRVATKRMRALLRLLGSRLGAEEYAGLDTLCRRLARDLASNRDSDVALDTLELLAADGAGSLSCLRLREALMRDGDRTCSPAELQTPDWQVIAQKLDSIDLCYRQLPLKGLHRGDLRNGFERGCRRGRKLWRQTRKKADMETLHEWRKAVKTSYYQSQLLRRSDNRADALKCLGSCLGDLHDLDMLEQRLLERRRWFWQEDLQWLESRLSLRRRDLLERARAYGRQIYGKSAPGKGGR